MKEKTRNMFNKISNNKKIAILSAFSILLIVIIFITLNSRNTFANSDKDLLSLTCSEIVTPGETINCTVSLNTVTIKGLGFQTSLVTSDNLIFDSYENNTTNNAWTFLGASSTSILYYSTTEIQGNYILGTLKYKVSEDAKPNDKFYVSLTSNILGGNNNAGETVEVKIDDVKEELRTLSDINSLSNIELSIGTLNETFNSDITSYTATIDSEKVIITATKTDANSIVTGDGEVKLHYGTNTVTITVTSENGISKDYNIKINRPYNFTSDNYIYNKENNYIYTKMDTDPKVIKSNITNLPNDLTTSISENKLIIKYSEEILLSINIINLFSNKYTVADNSMRIGNNIDYNDFISSIITNGVSIKIFNGSEEITSGILKENNTLKVYFNDTLIDEYTLLEEYLNFSDKLIIDNSNTNKIIKRIKANTTYGELKKEISTTGTITIKNGKDNSTLTDNSKVKTGDILEIKMQNDTIKYTISVLGDVSGDKSLSGKNIGDGIIDVGDVGQLYRYLKGKTEFEYYQIAAGDILSDSSIKVNDVARLYRYIKGKNSTLEVE